MKLPYLGRSHESQLGGLAYSLSLLDFFVKVMFDIKFVKSIVYSLVIILISRPTKALAKIYTLNLALPNNATTR